MAIEDISWVLKCYLHSVATAVSKQIFSVNIIKLRTVLLDGEAYVGILSSKLFSNSLPLQVYEG